MSVWPPQRRDESTLSYFCWLRFSRKRLIFSRRPTAVTVLELTSRYLKAMLGYTPVLRLWKTVVSTTAKLFDRSLDVHLSSTSAKLHIDRNWNENNRAKRESSLRRNSSLLVSEGRPPDNTWLDYITLVNLRCLRLCVHLCASPCVCASFSFVRFFDYVDRRLCCFYVFIYLHI